VAQGLCQPPDRVREAERNVLGFGAWAPKTLNKCLGLRFCGLLEELLRGDGPRFGIPVVEIYILFQIHLANQLVLKICHRYFIGINMFQTRRTTSKHRGVTWIARPQFQSEIWPARFGLTES